MDKILEQQELILRQQQKILETLQKLKDVLELMNLNAKRQYDELNSRLEINERSTRQIDKQIALSNELRHNELAELRPMFEHVELLEEFLRLDVATRLMNTLEG